MIKYLLNRLLRGIISVIAVVIIIMVMIYSLMDRSQIFANDAGYKQRSNNDQIVYMQERLEEYGYTDYVSFNEYVVSLNLDSEEQTEALSFGDKAGDENNFYIASDDNETTKKYLKEFVKTYTAEGYEIVRLKAAQLKGRTIGGGAPRIYAVREMPLITRIFKYFGGMFHIDNIHYAKNMDDSERGLTFTLHDPAYGGSKFAPAIMGKGTHYKYLLYFDNKFPFIHQNVLKVNLGTSYSIETGVDLTEIMSKTQGGYVLNTTYYPSGVVSDTSADNMHSLRYVEGSYSSHLNPQYDYYFVDDYTSTIYNLNGLSKVGYSFIIGIISVFFAYLIGVPCGISLARHKGKLIDKIGMVYIIFIIAVPSLAYIFMFKVIGGEVFNLPTTFSLISTDIEKWGWKLYVLPIVSLALPTIAGLMKWLRRYMIDQMNSDYVKFAKSGGLSDKEIFRKHIFKNAAIPIVHGIPAEILGALVGAIITERVYVIPGIGNILTKAINKYDNGVIVGTTLFYSSISVLAIILGDILMAIIDPRISFSSKGRQ